MIPSRRRRRQPSSATQAASDTGDTIKLIAYLKRLWEESLRLTFEETGRAQEHRLLSWSPSPRQAITSAWARFRNSMFS